MKNDHAFIKYAKDLHQICKPLFALTSVTYFSTVRVYPDGGYTGIVSDPAWASHYLQNNFDACSLEFYQAYLMKQPYILWSLSSIFEVDDTAKQLRKDCLLFDYTNGITLIERNIKYVDLYYFVSNARDKVDEFFIHNIDQLKLFILYFKNILGGNKEINNFYLNKYYKNNRCFQAKKTYEKPVDWTNTLKIKKYYVGSNNNYLTMKEMKILLEYIEGKSMKEIAKIYHCSPRTIEVHMVNIKNKLNIRTKSDLVTIAHSNMYLKNLLL